MATNLVIVESPAKAKTIGKYLGKDYKVLASVGHVRDLPSKVLGVDTDNGFALAYEVNEDKKKVISSITKEAKTAEAVYLATDYDREGEAIAWHITEACKIPIDKQRRITFTEITKKAVTEAVEHPRDIDQRLVDAQQARRGIDRLVGYPVSQLLWSKIRYGLSAGRVQSPALRLVVEREREIRAFVTTEYWTLDALLATDKDETFTASLIQIGERKVPTQIQKDSKDDIENRIPEQAQAEAIKRALDGATFTVADVRTKETKRTPPPPFITSTFQQDASRKLGLGARRAMSLAQRLYERGHITYMRTDSTTMSQEAIAGAATYVKSIFGDAFWSGRYKAHDKKAKGAQEAHECIRPTDMARPREQMEAEIRDNDSRDAEALIKVYDLVYKRAVASLMTPAVFDQVSVDVLAKPIEGDDHLFRATGSTIKFEGFMTLYLEGKDDDDEESDEKRLPPLQADQSLDLRELIPEQHFTQPPPRYTEASLIKELEAKGIGRPSTYASIMGTLSDEKRDFTRLEKKRFFATDTGEITTDFLVRYFGDHFMDFQFTSDMEEHLDDMAEGKVAYRPVVEAFYTPLQDRLNKAGEVPKEEITTEATDEKCPQCGNPLIIKLGRRGKFYGCTNYPDCRFTGPLPGQEQEAVELLDEKCPECGNQLQKRRGRFGPFVGCSNYPECKYIQKKTAVKTGAPCPKCIENPCKRCTDKQGGELVERSGKKGVFYGCDHYPACRHTQNEDPRKATAGVSEG
ncbi:MAG: type I DNA topoisomerase [Actinomycetota bacterium]